MKIENSFTVAAPIEEAWEALLDLERIAPCLPGASIGEQDGDEYKGTMTVKIGPINAKYEGKVKYEETDEQAHKAVLNATGSDARGQGTASATITSTMEEDAGKTKVNVETDMKLTGKAAQFGRGIAQDVASKMLGQFAECLEQRLGGGSEPSETAAASTSSGNGATESVSSSSGSSAASSAANGGATPGATTGSLAAGQESARTSFARPVSSSGGASSGASGGGSSSSASSGSSSGEEEPKTRKISQPDPEPLDLGEMSQDAVMKRVTPVLIGAGALLVIVWLIRRRH